MKKDIRKRTEVRIRDLDKPTLEKLQNEASAQVRSLAAQVKHILHERYGTGSAYE